MIEIIWKLICSKRLIILEIKLDTNDKITRLATGWWAKSDEKDEKFFEKIGH